MANQIGAFFRTQKPELAVASIADHLAKFWDPRMREKIVNHLEKGGEGLTPLVKDAVQTLKNINDINQ
jgi:formate dehydrogenase subunit delta